VSGERALARCRVSFPVSRPGSGQLCLPSWKGSASTDGNGAKKNEMVITNLFRWIHLLAGTAWLGEVLVVNVVLVPVLARLESGKREWFLAAIFPRIFRLASVLALTTVLAGAALNLSLSGWRVDVAASRLIASRWGWSILIGGSLGFGLMLFHFVAERRLEPHVVVGDDDPDGIAWARTLRSLKIIPRAGFGLLLLIVLLMMFAARGLQVSADEQRDGKSPRDVERPHPAPSARGSVKKNVEPICSSDWNQMRPPCRSTSSRQR
jgi:hypothetical protein